MKTSITTITETGAAALAARRPLPGWVWFIALWCAGVGGAVSLGFAFRILMDLTLFTVK